MSSGQKCLPAPARPDGDPGPCLDSTNPNVFTCYAVSLMLSFRISFQQCKGIKLNMLRQKKKERKEVKNRKRKEKNLQPEFKELCGSLYVCLNH